MVEPRDEAPKKPAVEERAVSKAKSESPPVLKGGLKKEGATKAKKKSVGFKSGSTEATYKDPESGEKVKIKTNQDGGKGVKVQVMGYKLDQTEKDEKLIAAGKDPGAKITNVGVAGKTRTKRVYKSAEDAIAARGDKTGEKAASAAAEPLAKAEAYADPEPPEPTSQFSQPTIPAPTPQSSQPTTPAPTTAAATVASREPKLICWDFDETLVNGHFHNALYDVASRRFEQDGVQVKKGKDYELVGGGTPTGNNPNEDVMKNLIAGGAALRNPDEVAKSMKQALDNGDKIAITSYTKYPQVIDLALGQLVGRGGLTQKDVDQIFVVGGFPKNGATARDENGKDVGKEEHIQAAREHFKDKNGKKIEGRNVIVVDDSPRNCEAAKAHGHEAVQVPKPPNPSKDYISQLNQKVAPTVPTKPQVTAAADTTIQALAPGLRRAGPQDLAEIERLKAEYAAEQAQKKSSVPEPLAGAPSATANTPEALAPGLRRVGPQDLAEIERLKAEYAAEQAQKKSLVPESLAAAPSATANAPEALAPGLRRVGPQDLAEIERLKAEYAAEQAQSAQATNAAEPEPEPAAPAPELKSEPSENPIKSAIRLTSEKLQDMPNDPAEGMGKAIAEFFALLFQALFGGAMLSIGAIGKKLEEGNELRIEQETKFADLPEVTSPEQTQPEPSNELNPDMAERLGGLQRLLEQGGPKAMDPQSALNIGGHDVTTAHAAQREQLETTGLRTHAPEVVVPETPETPKAPTAPKK